MYRVLGFACLLTGLIASVTSCASLPQGRDANLVYEASGEMVTQAQARGYTMEEMGMGYINFRKGNRWIGTRGMISSVSERRVSTTFVMYDSQRNPKVHDYLDLTNGMQRQEVEERITAFLDKFEASTTGYVK